MGVGYSGDQFFHSEEPSVSQTTKTGTTNSALVPANNQQFVYPNRVVRTHNGTFDLERGYIRSLVTYNSGVNIPLKKCAFQFNPDILQHSVSANSSMLNFLQQDPAQYAQPMGSSINFTFQLRFDRSYELNNPTNQVTTSGNVWETNDPSQVGVLHDLAALYNVIGQGVGSTQIDYLSKVMYNNAVTENNAKVSSSSADSTSTSSSGALTSDAMNTIRDKTVPDFLKNNIGNVTFLLPVPVRVVFSSLYIVEGIVQSTDVSFTKFTNKMVPMQCVVQLTMEAKYVGFAKKNTFYTWALEEQAKQQREEAAAQLAKKQDLVSAFRQSVQTMHLVVWDIDDMNLNGDERTGNSLTSVAKGKTYGFNVNLLPAKNLTKDTVGALFDNSSSLSVSHYDTVTLWGPFTDLSYAKSYGSDKLRTELQSLNSKSKATKVFTAFLERSCIGGYADSSKGWGVTGATDGASSYVADDPNFFQKWIAGDSYRAINFPATKASNFSGVAASSYDSSKYYIMALEMSLTATDADTTIKGTGSKYVLFSPNVSSSFIMSFDIPLTWPDTSSSTGDTGANATGGYTPGKTSTVGKNPVIPRKPGQAGQI